MEDRMKSLSQVVKEYQKLGYTKNFIFVEGMLRIEDKGYKPEEITVKRKYRFEGMSNPEDSSILYAVTTKDDEKGIIINSYGPDANLELNDFMENCNQTSEAIDD